MNGRPNYGQEALGRIERLGEKSIAAFFNEIPRELLKVVTGHLPPLAGFRPGTSTAVQRQLHSLAHKLATHRTAKAFARSPEETALYGLWRAWSLSQIPESATVRELLDGLDDEDDGAETSDKAEQVSTALKALAASGTCAREILERFVTYSPFEAVDGFLATARSARTAAEIKRDSTLLDLPDRLHKDEARLQLLETKLDASDRNSSLLRSDMDDIRGTVSDLRNTVSQLHTAVADARQAEDGAAEQRGALEEALARLTHATDRLTGRIAVNEKQAEIAATAQGTLEREVAGAASAVAQMLENLADHAARADRLTNDLRAQADAVKRQGERFAELDKLAMRIDQVESLVLELGDTKPGATVPLAEPDAATSLPQSPSLESGSLVVERLRLEAGLSVKPLRTAADILGSLDAALAEAGLKKSTASTFAEEILAAAASEQVIFLRGGFAVDLARKCALSICGTNVFRVAIPLGMTDPSLLRSRLNQRVSAAAPTLSAVVVEGANNSPLDLLRDVLLDQVTLRVGSFARQAPTIAFACLADGAGAFPIDASYFELGPVFDLEAMDWRRLRREKLPVLGSVAPADWVALSTAWDGKAIDYEEALRGAQRLSAKRNARVETNVVRAFSAVAAIRRNQSPTPLQSITFGWLAPYWQSLAAKVADIDAQIDGGKCDASTLDERLKIFLTEYRAISTGQDT